MPVFRHTPLGRRDHAHQLLLAQTLKRVRDCLLVVSDYGVAVGNLIAGVDERVQSQRIVFRRRQLLLDERAEYAHFNVV